MNYLTVKPGATTVMYAGRSYRIQNDRGHKHIVVIDGSGRRKITVKELQTDCVFDYIFGGGSVTHPCPAMEYWIYRHRLGHRITTKQYKDKFFANRETATPSPQPGEIVKRTKMITFLLILMFIVLGIGLSAIVLMVYFVITDDPYRDAMAIIKKHIK